MPGGEELRLHKAPPQKDRPTEDQDLHHCLASLVWECGRVGVWEQTRPNTHTPILPYQIT